MLESLTISVYGAVVVHDSEWQVFGKYSVLYLLQGTIKGS